MNNQPVIAKVCLVCMSLIACVLLYWGIQTKSVLDSKVAQQESQNRRLTIWLRDYEALLPVQQAWDEAYKPASEIKDRLSLYRVLELEQIGLVANPDLISEREIEAVNDQDGMYLGLTKICLSSGGQPRIPVMSPDGGVASLLRGARALIQTPGLSYESMEISRRDSSAELIIGKPCIYLREAQS